ncbi:uncharacterized protein LOC132637812 [Lycium barbarum]|uniref:uncharacterized protein LOC132637812 n=1 Tax=Lycium barbarum TaxID=112863 RepID=UPI00293EEFB9|nr:uncharacterized protein LOC132637812 [Lycium barbarum]
MTIKLVVGGFILHIISAYAPQAGLGEEDKRRFWEDSDEMMESIPSTEKLFIRGDFNGHIGSISGGYDNVHGGCGFGDRNGGGVALLDLEKSFGLMVANSKEPGNAPMLLVSPLTKTGQGRERLMLGVEPQASYCGRPVEDEEPSEKLRILQPKDPINQDLTVSSGQG